MGELEDHLAQVYATLGTALSSTQNCLQFSELGI